MDATAEDLRLDFGWDHGTEQPDARGFQREVMPLLYASDFFQRAVGPVVRWQRHLGVMKSVVEVVGQRPT